MMKKLNFMFIVITACLSIVSCDKDDNCPAISCEQTVVIDSNDFHSAPTDELTINSLEINDNCLLINYSSGGCDGDSWVLKLIDSGVILESNPPQRNLILSLKNEELCEAYITKEITFDVSSIQVDGNQVRLNITNTGDDILYTY